MATLTKVNNQFPQLGQFETGTPNIVALLRFESDGTATVGNSFSLNDGGGATNDFDDYGVFGKSVHLNPASSTNEDSFSRSSDSNFDYGTGKTWMCWVKPDTDPGHNSTVLSSGLAGDTTKITIRQGTGNWDRISLVLWNTGDTTSISFTSNTAYTKMDDGNFHHVAFVENSSTDHKFYVDGILHDSSTTNIGTMRTGEPWYIGASAFSNGIEGWDGWIDEVAVFDRAFSDQEMYAFGGALAI